MNPDDIKSVVPGDLLSAQRDEEILQALRRKLTAPNFIEHPGGWNLVNTPNRRICRFEMTDQLLLPNSGSGTATAHKLRWIREGALNNLSTLDEEPSIKVLDSMRMHSKMATVTGDVGAYGLAWIADDPMVDAPYKGLWEIITMQTPGPFYAILNTALSRKNVGGYQSATATVFATDGVGHRTLWGYDPFGDNWKAAYGLNITVWNPPRENSELTPASDPTLFWFDAKPGTCVFCVWNMRENKYYVQNVVANLTVTGEDAVPQSAVSNPCWKINFNTSNFIVVTGGEDGGEVTVSLR